MESSIFFALVLSLALGAVIGIERELPRHGIDTTKEAFWWIRSYGLIALLGALSTWLDSTLGEQHLWKTVGFIGITLFILIQYSYDAFKREKVGVTSEYAALLAYFMGMIVMTGYTVMWVICTVLTLVVLSSKDTIQNYLEKFSRRELWDTLKFAVIALVALPLLPDQKFSIMDFIGYISPGNFAWTHPILLLKFFNPYSVWFFVVIMTGVQYTWYILSRVIWDRGGILASGAVGGMISSTATTAAMTSKSLLHPNNRNAYASATLAASCIMFIRVILISAVVNPALLNTIIFPASAMFVTLTGSTYYYYYLSRKDRLIKTSENDEYESPFQIMPALQFAGIVVAIKFLSGIGQIYKEFIPQEAYNYILGAISWLADVDAITQTMASESVNNNVPLIIASSTILIAVISNNIVKWFLIAGSKGEKWFSHAVMTGFGISIISGAIIIGIMNFLM